MRGRLAAGMTALVMLSTTPLHAQPQTQPSLMQTLPDGLVKDVLQRMPAAQRAAVEAAAKEEVRQAQRDAGPGGNAASIQAERLIGTRLALLVAANAFESNSAALSAWQVTSASELRQAAMAPEVAKTIQGQSLLETPQGLDAIRKLLLATPYVYRPTTPCSEIVVPDLDRLELCVERQTFRSVVGLAWPNVANKLEISCTGQLISKTVVVTADHCFDGKTGKPVVLSHYTGGGEQAVLTNGNTVLNVRQHQTADVYKGQTRAIGAGLRGFDLAIVTLSAPVAFDGFPTIGAQLPDPVTFTVAGWGPSDVRQVKSTALEVTVISPRGDLRAIDPSLRAWAATPTAGGGICHSDSGGPVFSGTPNAAGAAQMRLVGLVAGGNLDCRSGEQVITDLTRPEVLQYLCALTTNVPNCRRT